MNHETECKGICNRYYTGWGLAVFLLTWWLIFLDGATGEIPEIGRVYLGYNISPAGSVVGLAWALFDGFIGGAVLAWIYNQIITRLPEE